jgi:uncharacterized cupin superfamily protein
MKQFAPSIWLTALLSFQPAFATPIATETTTSTGAVQTTATNTTNYKTLPNGTKIYGGKIYGFSAESAHTKDAHRSGRIVKDDVSVDITVGDVTVADAGWCGTSTIVNVGSDNSPLISDCQVAMQAVYSQAGDNNSYFGRGECGADSTGVNTCYYPVVEYGTCLFGASTVSAGSSLAVRIGWDDVGNLISDSISEYGGNPSSGKVGTLGIMSCPEENSGTGLYATAWGLYHS